MDGSVNDRYVVKIKGPIYIQKLYRIERQIKELSPASAAEVAALSWINIWLDRCRRPVRQDKR